jgi:hypothetical protein
MATFKPAGAQATPEREPSCFDRRWLSKADIEEWWPSAAQKLFRWRAMAIQATAKNKTGKPSKAISGEFSARAASMPTRLTGKKYI